VSLYGSRRIALPLPGGQKTYASVSSTRRTCLNARNYAVVGSVAGSPLFGVPLVALPGRSLRLSVSFDRLIADSSASPRRHRLSLHDLFLFPVPEELLPLAVASGGHHHGHGVAKPDSMLPLGVFRLRRHASQLSVCALTSSS